MMKIGVKCKYFFFKNELAVRLNINVYYWKQTLIFKRKHWHWYSLEIVNSEYINDRMVHSSDFYNKADRLRKQLTDRYLFHNRKTRHKSARIQSSLANIRDCSNRVAIPKQLSGAATETPDNRW